MLRFSEARQQFDVGPGRQAKLQEALVPVNGKPKRDIVIRNDNREPLEEYYKWQFVYALLHSGLYSKDYIGVEVHFPKGSPGAKPLKLDGAIFDDADWIEHYKDYWAHGRPKDLQWLNDRLLGVIEFKRDEKEADQVFSRQVKPAMKEKEPSDSYVLGIYYDADRLFLFHRRDGKYLRYDEAKNTKGINSQIGDLSLHLPDPYYYIPSFTELKQRVHRPSKIDRSKRGIADLETITSIATAQMTDALSNVLRTLDKAGLVNQRGYELLVQCFALKIFDEKRNERDADEHLDFYISDEERAFKKISEDAAQRFIERMKSIRDAATGKYEVILRNSVIDWKDPDHIRAVAATCEKFQDYSFDQPRVSWKSPEATTSESRRNRVWVRSDMEIDGPL